MKALVNHVKKLEIYPREKREIDKDVKERASIIWFAFKKDHCGRRGERLGWQLEEQVGKCCTEATWEVELSDLGPYWEPETGVTWVLPVLYAYSLWVETQCPSLYISSWAWCYPDLLFRLGT